MIVLAILSGCGSPEPSVANSASSQGADTLRAVDSIGILTGDSCCVIGHIIDAAPLPGSIVVGELLNDKVTLLDPDGNCLSSRSHKGLDGS